MPGQLTQKLSVRQILSSLFQLAATTLALVIVPYSAIHTKYYDLDPDIWWHIRVGDWIVKHHGLPHVAIFSQYSDRPWVAYSWCFELLVSGVHAMLGLTGIPKLLLCLEILISLMFLLSLRHIAGGFWRSWPIAVLGILTSQANPLRPVTASMLFFVLELLVIFEAERIGEDKVLYWLGPLFMLWANFHIQFVYGIAVVGIYVAARIVRLAIRRKGEGARISFRDSLGLAGIFAIAVLGSCIGPYGWLPYRVAIGLAAQTFVFQIIVEMFAMNFRSPLHYVELLLVMTAAFAIGRSRSRDLFRPMLLLMTAMVSFRSMRDMWFAAIASSFVIAEAVRARAAQTADTRQEKHAGKPEPLSYGLAVVLAVILSFGYGIRHGMNIPDMINEIGNAYPVQATEFVRNSHLPGPMYNSMNWGGFLIFNLRDRPVSIDGRTNIYGDQLLARSMATTSGKNWQTDPVFERANLFLLERTLPLAAYLAHDANYELVYQDPIAMVFVRRHT